MSPCVLASLHFFCESLDNPTKIVNSLIPELLPGSTDVMNDGRDTLMTYLSQHFCATVEHFY